MINDVEQDPKGCLYIFIGFIAIIGSIMYFCNAHPITSISNNDLAEKRIASGTYSATVKGTHEYRRDANGHVYARNDTTTVIE